MRTTASRLTYLFQNTYISILAIKTLDPGLQSGANASVARASHKNRFFLLAIEDKSFIICNLEIIEVERINFPSWPESVCIKLAANFSYRRKLTSEAMGLVTSVSVNC